MSKCVEALLKPEVQKELFGDRQMPEDAIRRVVQDIEKLKKLSDDGKLGSFESRVSEYIKEKVELTEAQQLMKASNLLRQRERMGFLMQEGAVGNIVEAFKSMLDGTGTIRLNEGQKGVTTMAASMQDKFNGLLFGALREKGVAKHFHSDLHSREVYMAVEALALGKNPEGIGEIPLKIAQAVHETNKAMFQSMRNAKIPIRDMPGFVTRQTHDFAKVADFDNWINKVMPLLDQKKTFGVDAGDPVAMRKTLLKIHEKIRSGQYGLDAAIDDSEISDQFVTSGRTRSISSKLSEARTLRFSDGEAAWKYNQEFGTGTLAETLAKEMKRNARLLSLVHRFGDRPKASLLGDIERATKLLKRNGRSAEADYLQSKKKRIEDMFDEIAAVDRTPGSGMVAKAGAGARVLNVLSKLMATGARSVSNLAGGAVELRNVSGHNLMGAQLQMVQKAIANLPAGMRDAFGDRAKLFYDDMQAHMMDELHGGVIGVGHRLARYQMMFNGMDVMNNATRFALANLLSNDWAKNINLEFGKLPKNMQAGLLESGIDASDWKYLKGAVETTEDGRAFLTPEGIRNLTDGDIKAIMKEKGLSRKKGKMSVEAYREDLELRLRGRLIESGDLATTTAGYRERSALNYGTDAGTVEGELLRTLFQFKSFFLQGVNIGKRFLNANVSDAKLEKGILHSQGKDMKGFAQWIVMGSAFAYMADSAWRTATGREVDSPDDPKTWLKAMTMSGAGGVYMDFLNGQWNKYSFVDSLAGPTFGQTGKLAEAFAAGRDAAIDGKNPLNKQVLSGASRLIRSNIPFQQAPGVTQLLNHLQYKEIQEMITPGFNAKHELKEARKKARGE